MKLSTKYNRINIITSTFIFLAGCIAFYFVLNYFLLQQLDETLAIERDEITNYVNEHNTLPEIVKTKDQQIYFSLSSASNTDATLISKTAWNDYEKEKELVRQLNFGINAAGKHYMVTVVKSQAEKEDLLKLILIIAASMIALILTASFVINRIALKKLWQPFYRSVMQVRNYNLQSQQALQLPSTKIEEFSFLNSSLNMMASRVEAEYQSLKEFTGNASHEMQTPLAIISANTESLLQDSEVMRHHHTAISTIENAAKRLSRLNQSLLLLAKIENNRFELTEKIDLKSVIEDRINDLQELISANQLKLEVNTASVVTVFHHHLADILIGNLTGNAIRYNIPNGIIKINLSEKELIISNTSSLPMLDPTKIFSRFYRHPLSKAEGTGLGLSIVQHICLLGGYRLVYKYSNDLHIFCVQF